MEGPSLFLAAEQLAPFIGKTILSVDGNTKIGKDRFLNQKVLDIFSWGKHLVFQFETFALRVHFMLFGSFQAVVNGIKVTGDYAREKPNPRLVLTFENGQIVMYSCSLRFIEEAHAKLSYDFSRDTMSEQWDASSALKKVKKHPRSQIGDVLLNQDIFAGVGNIIKNEVLFLTKIQPERLIEETSNYKLSKIVRTVREFVFQFYEWRKQFVLRKHYRIYKKKKCTKCEHAVVKKHTGQGKRVSYICTVCQR